MSGALAAVAVCIVYARIGYHAALPSLLVGAVVAVAWSLPGATRPSPQPRALRFDLIALGVLILIMAPLYWWRLYTIPWQVNTDEVTIMSSAQQMLLAPDTDLLGLSWYFGFPAAIFVAMGRLGQLLGGIDLYHMRLAHSLFGVGSVLLAYGLFRQFCRPFRAATLAVILGANHALFAISRMAMRDNTGLFLELLALLLLVRGLQRRSRAMTFLGGAATGLTFYTYFPSRITLVLWLMVMAGIWVLRPRRPALMTLATYATLFLAGWAMVATPVLIASVKHRDLAFGYQRQQFLFYPEGRMLEQQWTSAATGAAAWTINIKQGLATFNGRMHDQGYIYANYRHAFVDPVTGILLWIGLVVAAVRLCRSRKPRLPDLLALTGFLVLYLSFALVITKAPNYTRLLVILPFVAWLAGTGLWWLAETASTRLFTSRTPAMRAQVAAAVVALGVAVIVTMNVNIFGDYVSLGVRNGNDVGSTARFVEARKQEAGHTWVLASDSTARYYGWGNKWQWQTWLGFFAARGQPVRVIPPANLESLDVSGAFTLFMTRAAWTMYEPGFRLRHRVDSVTSVVPDGRLIAVEVSGPT